MTPERWQRIKSLLESALEHPPLERAAFLKQACADDPSLQSEVESLVSSHEQSGGFIESPAVELMAESLGESQSIVGSDLGPYRVTGRLGAGGMGEVYLAEDTRLGRKVAVKVLLAHFTIDEERVRRFQQEARAASALNHPNILTIYEIGEIRSRHFIVTELIEGETLRQHLSKAPIKISEALDIAIQIASALTAAHAAAIVHRDIKPDNVMVRADSIVKVLDFGLAKLTEARSGELEAATLVNTKQGMVMGTAHYMSPEQARGLPVDTRTDIWSLGVVIYEMVAGRVPFEGGSSSDVIASILDRKPITLARYAPHIPPELEWIVEKTLRKVCDERYQTAKELLTDLRNLKRRLEFAEDLDHSDGGQRSAHVARRPESGSSEPSYVKAQSKGSQSPDVIDSLAILPLANTSANPSMDYFSDGISESMINSLSQLTELRVMAWSTVSRYRTMQVDPREAARELGVRAVLTGRIMQLGERLVIKIELVDARDGSHLWGESYSCQPSEILDIESEIASEISQKLLLRLTTEERKQLTKRYTDNVEAYHAYLRGRYCWNKRTDEDVRKAIDHFKQAIDNDPSYALAYSGLADSYLILGSFGIATMSPREAFPKAREATLRALEIDDTLAEAHASLANNLANYDWNWPAAERAFKRCFELKPGYATAHHWYGFVYLTAVGLVDQAIAEVREALKLDPLSLPVSANVGFLLYLARRHDEAIDQFQKTLEMDQNFVYSHWELALAYEQKQMYGEAIAEFQKAISLSGRSTLPIALLGHAYAVSGQESQAFAVLDQLSELSKERYVSPYRIAAIHAGLGDKDRAFQWLDRAYEERDGWLVWLRLDPVMEVLSPDRRFTDLLGRIGLLSTSEQAEVLPSIKPSSSAARSSRPTPSRKAIRSLAILPLVNTVDDPELDYFGDGITESIINTLSQFPKLRVVARSTVFRYKNQQIDPQEVGRLLDVQAVLTGRVRQVADRLIISTELIDVANDSQLWGENYNRNLSDIFAVQEEIAREITEKLRLKLSPGEKARLGKRHTHTVEAYQAYLKGRYHWNKRTTESLHKGVEYFKQAIDRDPAYASAYAGLSDSYSLLVVREAIAPEEGFAKAKAAASMALKIDEEFAEAHASLGHAMLHNWEWSEGENELKRAIKLNPGYASAHHWYSEHLTAMGRCDESIAELKLAGGLDPLSLVISADLGRAFYYAREYDQVMNQEARTLEMDPNFWLSHINLGRAHTQLGSHADAIGELKKASELSGGNTEALSFLGFAYAAAGKCDDALKTLNELNEQSQRGYVPPYHLAIVHAGLGEKDKAFEWLEQAFERHAVDMFTLKVEPMFDSLRSDQRFEDLVRRVGLASPEPYEKSTAGSLETEVRTKAIAQAKPAAIAVLPFRPISTEGRDEILELGIADALITKLSDISQIIVRPTSSIRKYIDLQQDSATAGRELAVESVLEGNIQKLGGRIRITARLVKVEDGRSLWNGKFDEEFTDIFAVEDLISEKVTAALALKLTGTDRERLKRRYTDDTAAHHLYLKGRYYWNKRTEEALNRAIECFEQAIEIDQNYALAYAGVADCYTKLGDVGVTAMLPKEAFTRARAAAMKALKIDDSLAEVHASLGHINMHHLRWADAERDYKRAIELNPNYATAHQWYAYYMAFHCRFDEALERMAVAFELDPLSLPIADGVGEFLYFARRNDEAIKQFRKVLEMEPNFLPTRINLGLAYEQSGMFSEAEEQFVKAREIAGESMDALAAIGHMYAKSGRTGAASKVLARLTELTEEGYVSPYEIALMHTALGESEEAFRWLEKAYDERVEWLIFTNVDPRLDPLRGDARFHDLMRRIGFAPSDVFHRDTTHKEKQRTLTASEQQDKVLDHAGPLKAWLTTRGGKIFLALAFVTILAGLGYLLLRRSPGVKETAAQRNFTFTQLTDQPGPEFFPSLSPDGKSLIYASRATGNWDIYMQQVGDRNSINLTKDSHADDTQPAFSPDGQRIAFRSDREGGGIYLMGAAGESVTRLSDFGYSPSWSPEGEQILFGTEKIPQPSTRPSKSQLWTINVKTNERRLISEGDALQPNCSPHRQRIAYWSRPNKAGQRESLWTIPADGGEAVAVTNGSTADLNPVWSTDGKYLYFSSSRGGSINVWRVAIDETSGAALGEPEAVTSIGASTSALYLTFSRDGRRLAYVAQEDIRNLRKISFDSATGKTIGEPTSITRGSMQLWFPDVSPDGEWLTACSRGQQRHVFIVRTDGSDLRDLTNDNYRHDGWPRWSPDGKRIVFTSRRSGNYDLWIINRDGNGLQQLTQANGAHYSPWSRDGRMIAYSIHTPKNDCVVVQPDKAWNEQKLEYLPPLSDPSLSFEGWSWSPDGTKLAGVRHLPNGVHSGIGVYDLASKNYTWLTDFGDWPIWFNDDRHLLFVSQGQILLFDTQTKKYQPVLMVTDQDVDIGSPGLSPDNRTIYFTYVAAEADIWLMTLE